jgi:hypothetical protein
MLRVDDWTPIGSTGWRWMALIVAAGRAADLVSTRLATPTLAAEANPLARWLGWRWGVALNAVVVVPLAAMWPLVAVSLAVSSSMVAARNLQWAWIIRSMGEHEYRHWMGWRVAEAGPALPFACHVGEAVLVIAVGACLMTFAEWRLAPFGVGLGLVGYGVAVGSFTTLSLWRARARPG